MENIFTLNHIRFRKLIDYGLSNEELKNYNFGVFSKEEFDRAPIDTCK